MVVALKPLHDLAKIRRVVVSTYQSVSGAGKDAMDELFNQTRGIYMNETPEPEKFTKQIAFNCIPHIDKFMDDHMTKEEWKMVAETKKILDPKIKVCANCVRVPVFIGHAEMVNVEFEEEITAKQALKAWRDFEGVTVIDLDSEMSYVTPAEIAGEDDVFVSRVREDSTVDNGLNFWCVADNLRKGAALNAVQIAEVLVKGNWN
jgi:aspartate-semialdehyde dehydrogenase